MSCVSLCSHLQWKLNPYNPSIRYFHSQYLGIALSAGHIIQSGQSVTKSARHSLPEIFLSLYAPVRFHATLHCCRSTSTVPLRIGWYRQVVPLACQLVKKIEPQRRCGSIFSPHCLLQRCYLLMGFAPETPWHKSIHLCMGWFDLCLFSNCDQGTVAD